MGGTDLTIGQRLFCLDALLSQMVTQSVAAEKVQLKTGFDRGPRHLVKMRVATTEVCAINAIRQEMYSFICKHGTVVNLSRFQFL